MTGLSGNVAEEAFCLKSAPASAAFGLGEAKEVWRWLFKKLTRSSHKDADQNRTLGYRNN